MSDQTVSSDGGFNFKSLDAFARLCQALGKTTAGNAERLGFAAELWSYGESCHVVKGRSSSDYVGMTIEGLGTKSRVADLYTKIMIATEVLAQAEVSVDAQERLWWMALAQDCVAMIVNDMITVGVLPVHIGMHLAVANANWFDNVARREGLAIGWKNSCDESGAIWGPGETAALQDIIIPGCCELNGASWGVPVDDQAPVDGSKLEVGDAIVMVESSGIHANGLTKAREIGQEVGYDTEVEPGVSYASALLRPTHLYVQPVEACLRALTVHYMVNMTGHGWRKLMRYADRPFTYWIDRVAAVQSEFGFIARHAGFDLRQMYADYNMGGGFALMVREADVEQVIAIFAGFGLKAWRAGTLRAATDGRSSVVLDELDIRYDADELQVR